MKSVDLEIKVPNNVKFNFKYYKDLPNCIHPRPYTNDCPSKLESSIPNNPNESLKYVILQTFREKVEGCSRQLWIDGPDRNLKCCKNSNDSYKLPFHSCDTKYSDIPMYDCRKQGKIIFYTIIAETSSDSCYKNSAALCATYTLLKGVSWGLKKISSKTCKSLCLRKMTKSELEENREMFTETYPTAIFKI